MGLKINNESIKAQELKLYQKLILNKYFLRMLSIDKLEELPEAIKLQKYEGINEENTSKFYDYFINEYIDKCTIPKEKLAEYDENIVRHTKHISEKRENKIKLKYFQYIALLFTEIFLDKYFSDKDAFIEELNEYVEIFNNKQQEINKIERFIQSDLNKLAYWNATGSGKTLIMHINILQYMHYLQKNKKESEINKIILITPNEGLSNQHVEELKLSNIAARLFDKNLSSIQISNNNIIIEVIDIHKIKDESGDKTVAADSFESNNLVLVDEGHKGSSGEEWKSKRDMLCKSGFAFEYSATFGQAVQSSNKIELNKEYCKCIIFDYSYRYFYKDGFGKDYNIMNLAHDDEGVVKDLYMISSLLCFYQQKKLYIDKKNELKVYNLENPLLVFVGGDVNAVRKSKSKNISDVVDIIMFLSRFIKRREDSIRSINKLIKGNSRLLDSNGIEIFNDSFKYLIKLAQTAEEIYIDILEQVFNCDYYSTNIYLDNLKGINGEIAIRLGNNEYFGVIYVGDDSNLLNLCREKGIDTSENEFKESLFTNISDKESRINLLIGSKKFTEGWNSYRVSTMGLMNVGRSEGAEIIQLFGRGIRLKGKDYTLKRSCYLRNEGIVAKTPEYIDILENLNIFGIRADYMSKFKEFLDEEGIKTTNKPIILEIPIKKIKTGIENKNLKTLKIPQGLDFKADCRMVLSLINEGNISNKIKYDMYPTIEFKTSNKVTNIIATKEVGFIKEKNIIFINMNEIYFELIRYKNEKRYYNISIVRDELEKIIRNNNWYELKIPQEELELKEMNDFTKWKNIIITLLKKYLDFFYKYKKSEYEAPHMYYDVLKDNDPNLDCVDKYFVTIENPDNNNSLKNVIIRLKEELIQKEIEMIDWENSKHGIFQPIYFDRHLYNPLIHIDGNEKEIKIAPKGLNKGEEKFVSDIKKYYQSNIEKFDDKKIYLLRNKSKQGIGFFEAGNFYPDFILWIIEHENQFINFIDPKGIRNINDGFDNPKIKLHKVIKEIEKRLQEQDNGCSVELNSFIIANTKYSEVSSWGTREDFIDNNILFQDDNSYIEIMFNNIKAKPNLSSKEIIEIALV